MAVGAYGFDLDAHENDCAAEKLTGLCVSLENVSFTYPGASAPALHDLSLEIRAGEKLAIVGANGAGKSTLTKLLMGLYEPGGGRVLIDGKDTSGVRPEALREVVGAVRQDFQIYAASLCENVIMDEVSHGDGESHGEGEAHGDRESHGDRRISALALEAAGLGEWASQLPGGLDHTLTREFEEEGALPSGGEAQKLALSRLFARMPPICLLDEPSAALDPIAEAELNQAMLRAAGGRTLILISHRLSTTRFCDRIVLLEDGRVAEQGSHDALMELGGQYALMFSAQAGRYGG